MSTMDSKSNYQNDLEGIPGLPSNIRDNPFIVPTDYFNRVEIKIRQRIKIIDETEKSFVVPEHYFESLQDRILARLDQEEQVQEDPFIQQLKQTLPDSGFSVPTGYFEQVNDKIKERLFLPDEKGESYPVIPLNGRKRGFILSWIQYAAAACVILSVGIYGIVRYQSASFDRKLETISDQAILEYLEYYSEPGDGAIIEAQFDDAFPTDGSHLSNEEIQTYLDNSI